MLRSSWLLCALVALVPASPALAFSDVFFFGASYTDSGNQVSNFGRLTLPNGTCGNPDFYPSPPYAGNCSNGPVWSEVFAAGLGLAALPSSEGGTNYAVGGATAAPDVAAEMVLDPADPVTYLSDPDGDTEDFGDQLGRYLGANSVDPAALYVIMPGANDIHFTARGLVPDTGTRPQDAVDAIMGIAAELSGLGAQHFLFVNLFDFGIVPEPAVDDALATALTDEFNSILGTAVAGLAGVDATLFDLHAVFENILANPGAFGLTNTSDACLDPNTLVPCANPDQYLFWDGLHTSSVGMAAIGDAALATLPEPEVTLLLLGFAAWAVLRRPARP